MTKTPTNWTMQKPLKLKAVTKQLDAMSHEDLMRGIKWVIVFAIGILAAVFGIYLLRFATPSFSNDPAVWGQFGDFVGGTANPILGFLTLITLALTIVVQSRQLAISTRELELSSHELALTRTELQRSAQAQELSEKALRAQAEAASRSARLSAINFLLEHYHIQLKQFRGNAYLANDPRLETMRELEMKETALQHMLETVFDQLMDMEDQEHV